MLDTRDTRQNDKLSLIGGRLSLDFVNTLSWRGTVQPIDRLGSYADLLAWCRLANLIGGEQVRALVSAAAIDSSAAEAVVTRARTLREALHRILNSEGQPSSDDIAIINREIAQAPPRKALGWTGTRLAWLTSATADELQCLLWPIVWSTGDVLAQDERERVRTCADPRCGWLFYDSSRKRSRRWCSMADCGNRAKARRHYLRVRKSTAD